MARLEGELRVILWDAVSFPSCAGARIRRARTSKLAALHAGRLVVKRAKSTLMGVLLGWGRRRAQSKRLRRKIVTTGIGLICRTPGTPGAERRT